MPDNALVWGKFCVRLCGFFFHVTAQKEVKPRETRFPFSLSFRLVGYHTGKQGPTFAVSFFFFTLTVHTRKRACKTVRRPEGQPAVACHALTWY